MAINFHYLQSLATEWQVFFFNNHFMAMKWSFNGQHPVRRHKFALSHLHLRHHERLQLPGLLRLDKSHSSHEYNGRWDARSVIVSSQDNDFLDPIGLNN